MLPVDPIVLAAAKLRFSDLDHVSIGLAVLDARLNILFWNPTLESWTGIERADAEGRALSSLNPVWSKPHYESRLAHLFAGGPPVVFSPLLHPKLVPQAGHEVRSYQVKATSVPDGGTGWWAILSVEDVTVLARRIDELRALHAQQDRMMREIHHRVKNNLNLISGLISLQRHQPGNEAAVGALDDLQSRIVAISEIHDRLHHASDLSAGSTAAYLTTLAELTNENLSLTADHRLVLNLDPDIVLKTDTTQVLGLVQSELMTNALKYGLAGRPGEELSISLVRRGAGYRYELTHTGNRLPAGFDPSTSAGLGMVLLTAYAAQLSTRLRWAADDITRFWLEFTE